MSTEIVSAYDRPGEVIELFREYTDMLIEADGAFREYLDIQNYEDELSDLSRKYGMPGGRLYLALCGGEAAGCIALRKIDEERCELKRLYVRPRFRGKGLGSLLVARLIEDAKSIGYSAMLLDTLPYLESAIRIYERFGFSETESFRYSPMGNSIFLKLDL